MVLLRREKSCNVRTILGLGWILCFRQVKNDDPE
jgi:hypothetical protein